MAPVHSYCVRHAAPAPPGRPGMIGAPDAWSLVTRALFPAADRGGRIVSLLQGADELWPDVVELSGDHLVTPAAWLGLRRPELAPHVPAEAAHYLQTLHALNVERNERILAQLDEMLAALRRRSVTPLLLKGGAQLKLNVHGDLGARVLTDLDLLVQKDSFAAARSALDELGYRPIPDEGSRFHHDEPLAREGDRASVELHWSPLGRRAANVLADGTFWQRATLVSNTAQQFYVLGPNDSVMLLFAHGQIVDRHADTFQISLRALQDLVALTAFHGDRIDWERLTADLAGYGYESEWLNFLYVAQRVTGIQLPGSLRFGLRQRAHYALCVAALVSGRIDDMLTRLSSLSRHEMRLRYGGNPSGWEINARRLRFLTERARSRLFSRSV